MQLGNRLPRQTYNAGIVWDRFRYCFTVLLAKRQTNMRIHARPKNNLSSLVYVREETSRSTCRQDVDGHKVRYSSFLLLVVRPGATFVASLLLVAMPFAPSSFLAPSSDARSLDLLHFAQLVPSVCGP